MRTKLVTVLLLVAQASCSLGMKSVPRDWDGSSEPECSDSYAAPLGDGLVSALAMGVGVAAAEDEEATGESKTAIVLGALVVGIGFGVAAFVGGDTAKECKDARNTWRVGGAIGRATSKNAERERDEAIDAEIEKSNAWCATNGNERVCGRDRDQCLERADASRARDLGECVRSHEEVAVVRPQPPRPAQPAQPPAPRGYFCASSPSAVAAGLCTREKSDCVRARDAALALITDMTECALVETAQCFDANGAQRCSPSVEACDAQRQRAGATNDCKETK